MNADFLNTSIPSVVASRGLDSILLRHSFSPFVGFGRRRHGSSSLLDVVHGIIQLTVLDLAALGLSLPATATAATATEQQEHQEQKGTAKHNEHQNVARKLALAPLVPELITTKGRK